MSVTTPLPRYGRLSIALHWLIALAVIANIARKHGVSKAAVSIAWSLLPERQGGSVITIPGTTNLEHLAENARAAEIEFDDEDVAALNGMPAPAQPRY